MNAESKGLDLEQVIEKIENLYPEPKKRGCWRNRFEFKM